MILIGTETNDSLNKRKKQFSLSLNDSNSKKPFLLPLNHSNGKKRFS